MTTEYNDELLNYGIAGVCDLSTGDAQLALASLRKAMPYFGVCYTDYHVQATYDRLAQEVFKDMIENKNSKWFDQDLARVVKSKRTVAEMLGGEPKEDTNDTKKTNWTPTHV